MIFYYLYPNVDEKSTYSFNFSKNLFILSISLLTNALLKLNLYIDNYSDSVKYLSN